MTSNKFQGKLPLHNRSQTLRAALRIEPCIGILAVFEVVNEQSNNLSASCLPVKGTWKEAGGYDVVVSLGGMMLWSNERKLPGAGASLRVQTHSQSDETLMMSSCDHMCLWYTCSFVLWWQPKKQVSNTSTVPTSGSFLTSTVVTGRRRRCCSEVFKCWNVTFI